MTELRRLVRSRDDKMIAGVCAGLADYLDVDVTIVRVVTVALAIFGGGGLLLYAVMWLLMPAADSQATSPQDTAKEAVDEMRAGVQEIADSIKKSTKAS